MLHLGLHFLVPLVVALAFYRSRWIFALAMMLLAFVIDIDHLSADPIYDPTRCSMGFHPLHTLIPVGCYLAIFAHERTRIVGLGLLIHVALDSIDCQVTNGVWWT